MNRSITNKFPIETLLEMIDSSKRTLGKPNMIGITDYNIMSQSYVQGGFNGFSVLSHDSQLVTELDFMML